MFIGKAEDDLHSKKHMMKLKVTDLSIIYNVCMYNLYSLIYIYSNMFLKLYAYL